MALAAAQIGGIIPALVTAFREDESVDLPGVRAHTRRALNAGAHGVFALGTNGEFFVLTEDEKVAVLQAVVTETAGAVPVYAGTGTIGTRDGVQTARRLVAAGADVLSIISPYFAAASQEELYRHFRTIAEAVEVPVLVYNIPARTGVQVNPETIERLATVPNIVGVKDSSGNFDTILQYLERTDREEFAVISGNDALILWTLLAGGTGGITAVANIYPRTLVEIYEAWKAGDIATARARQDALRPIRNCFRHGNPNTVVKVAANLAGAAVGPCRAPFNHLSAEARADIEATIAADQARGLS
ncbi:MAG: 4-hydroxy-tetrahydrodipicolinate synthase [Propioniciclava sp.]